MYQKLVKIPKPFREKKCSVSYLVCALQQWKSQRKMMDNSMAQWNDKCSEVRRHFFPLVLSLKMSPLPHMTCAIGKKSSGLQMKAKSNLIHLNDRPWLHNRTQRSSHLFLLVSIKFCSISAFWSDPKNIASYLNGGSSVWDHHPTYTRLKVNHYNKPLFPVMAGHDIGWKC